jgi:hypothetical protein
MFDGLFQFATRVYEVTKSLAIWRFILQPYLNKVLQRNLIAWRYWFFAAADRPYVMAIWAFITTVTTARTISRFRPLAHWELPAGLHLHHYVFGIFSLAFAGYVAMVFRGPRATFFIAMLYGFGLGLTFDEFGIWIHGLDPLYRSSGTGLKIVSFAFIFGGACVYAYKRAIVPSDQTEQLSQLSAENEAEASVE